MMRGLCKDDIKFATQRSRDLGQDDARMIRFKNEARQNIEKCYRKSHFPSVSKTPDLKICFAALCAAQCKAVSAVGCYIP